MQVRGVTGFGYDLGLEAHGPPISCKKITIRIRAGTHPSRSKTRAHSPSLLKLRRLTAAEMALLASVSSPSIASSKIHGSLLRNGREHRVLVTCSAKFPGTDPFFDPAKLRAGLNYAKDKVWEFVPGSVKRLPFPGVEQFYDPEKVRVGLNYAKDKVWEFTPDSVKQFPWKKAEIIALQEGLVLAKKALKWTLIAYFAFGAVTDALYTISRNKELVIPFGLFVGGLMANYIDDISQEVLGDYKVGDNFQRLMCIACIFVLVRILSGGSYFIVHAANGGLMQVLWKWYKLPKEDADGYLMEDTLHPEE